MPQFRDTRFSWNFLLHFGALLFFTSIPACLDLEPGIDPYIITAGITTSEEGYYELRGSVVNIGIKEILDHGFCWSESPDPTRRDWTHEIGSQDTTGSFYGRVYHLLANTTLYIRAFARTRNNTFYGNQITFSTPVASLPVINTQPISALTDASVVTGGEILFSGGVPISQHGVCWSTSPGPTIADSNSNDGSGAGEFTSYLSELTPSTVYYLRAYATNGLGTSYGDEVLFKTYAGSVIDVEGNVYGTVKIGSQTWMGSNLKVGYYFDGTKIPLVEITSEWNSLGINDRAYCWYNNDADLGDTYGALYNWAAAMKGEESSDLNPSGVQGVCPDGWHLPSIPEWDILVEYLGGLNIAGGELKEAGNEYWNNPNTGATNSTFFSALPGGYRNSIGSFTDVQNLTNFWGSTRFDVSSAYYVNLTSYNSYIDIQPEEYNLNRGYSVRCVKDE